MKKVLYAVGTVLGAIWKGIKAFIRWYGRSWKSTGKLGKAGLVVLAFFIATMILAAVGAVLPAQPTPTPKPKAVAVQTPASSSRPVTSPSATPKPTNTPKPTKTPKPTNTPKPTDTPKPTSTPKPTNTPKPTEPPLRTLPTSRDDIQKPFEKVGFTFSRGKDIHNQPNIIGTAPNNIPCTVQLIGPANHLTEAALLIVISSDKSVVTALGTCLALFMINATPSWADSANWASTHMKLLSKDMQRYKNTGDRDISIIHNDYMVNMLLMPLIATLTITIDPAPDKTLEGVITTSGSLNVRANPGTDEKIVGKLKSNSKVTIIGQYNKCEWLNVTTPHLSGWVYSKYVKSDFDCEKVFGSLGEGHKP